MQTSLAPDSGALVSTAWLATHGSFSIRAPKSSALRTGHFRCRDRHDLVRSGFSADLRLDCVPRTSMSSAFDCQSVLPTFRPAFKATTSTPCFLLPTTTPNLVLLGVKLPVFSSSGRPSPDSTDRRRFACAFGGRLDVAPGPRCCQPGPGAVLLEVKRKRMAGTALKELISYLNITVGRI